MQKIFFILLLFSAAVQAQEPVKKTETATIGFNPAFSFKMLEPVQQLRKIDLLLEERKAAAIPKRGLIIGTSLIGIADYQHSNTNSKFAYLMRHPTSANEIGHNVSEAVIHSFQLSVTGAVNSWITLHAEMLYNPEQSFGAGTITALTRNQLQLRTGYFVLGDLTKFPVYLAIGKMDGPFGLTGSVSPFSNSSMWHAFGTLGYGAQAGFKRGGLNITAMAAQGGAQFRSLNMPVGDSTNVPSQLNNYIVDANYKIKVSPFFAVMLGGSYLRGSGYCQDFPVIHFNPGKESNPAYTAYAKITAGKKIILQGAYAQTVKVWKGTHNPHQPLDIFPAAKASSLCIGAKYEFNPSGKIVYALSGEFSNFRAGAKGAPWERQNQILLGFSGTVMHSARLFIELFRTDGYSPLNNISGSATNNPLPDGISPSVRDAFSHGVVAGGMITF